MKLFAKMWLFFLCMVCMHSDLSARVAVIAKPIPLSVSYVVDNTWDTGYEVTVTIKNIGGRSTKSWQSAFSLPDGQMISSIWNGTAQVTGQLHAISSPSWVGGGVINPGASFTYGMIIDNPENSANTLIGLTAVANGKMAPPAIPVAPSIANITQGNTPDSFTVSWNAVLNATSYTLQQDTSEEFTAPQIIAEGDVLTHSFSNQVDGTYFYRVNASNSSGASAFSEVKSITVAISKTLAAPVLNSIVNANGDSSFSITWNEVPNALMYTLEESNTCDFVKHETVISLANTSFEITNKSAGDYFYRVVAFAESLMSLPSNVEKVTVIDTPPQETTIPFVESYWESWNSTSSIAEIAAMKVDVISISFGNFETTGDHTFKVSGLDASLEAITEFVNEVHNVGKKVKISIGGATYPIAPQLVTVDDAVGMAHAIQAYIHENNLDGVDLDIEDYPAPALQVALIQNLRQLLGTGALISYTPKTPAATTYPYDQVIQASHTYLTDISFMAYDFGPGYTYQQDVTALIATGVPSAKIVIGLMPGMDDVGFMTSVADIEAAAHFVVENKLGGIMFWDLNRDHENLTGLGVDAATNAVDSIFH